MERKRSWWKRQIWKRGLKKNRDCWRQRWYYTGRWSCFWNFASAASAWKFQNVGESELRCRNCSGSWISFWWCSWPLNRWRINDARRTRWKWCWLAWCDFWFSSDEVGRARSQEKHFVKSGASINPLRREKLESEFFLCWKWWNLWER